MINYFYEVIFIVLYKDPLYCAVEEGNLDIIKILMESKKYDINNINVYINFYLQNLYWVI